MRRITLMNKNERIVGILHEGDDRCVIGAHGLQSSKESEKMKMLGERFSSEGISFFRFDFRGCGESEGDESRSTLSERISDLLAVMRFLRENEGMRRFSLIGSSFGGCVSIAVASFQKVESIVTLATPVRFEGRRIEGFNELYREDLRKYDLLKMASSVSKAHVIHGERDEVVPLEDAHLLYEALQHPKRLTVIENGDHRFSNPEHRRKVVELSVEWTMKFI
ncbi:MAG: uncharacterized protein PWR13_196 [Archaeoglobi archaeon]|nr:uncharacterized protein [Archaeoglobi archaeon]MDK2781168.1 uncharacterized protein [Archaeoglobi archaeon]